MKNSWLFLLAGLPSLAFAEDSECCEALLPPEPIDSCQVPVGYFYPAQYTFGNCGYDISFSGEFIYWEVNRDSSSSVGTLVNASNNGLALDEKTLMHYQGYRPGFKIGAGIGLPGCDDWKFDVEYTWFHHTSTNHFNTTATSVVTAPFLVEIFGPALFGFAAGGLKSVLKFDLDFIQGVGGRTFYLSQRLIVNAGIGLKAWWSSLNSSLTYFPLPGGTLSTQNTRTRLWGIGPYASAQIKGLLWCGTYLFGKAGVWPTYTRITKHKIQNNFPGFYVSTESVPSSYYTTQLLYEGGIGLGWGTYLCNCDYHIDLLVGYDMMTNFLRDPIFISTGNPHREFYYQGLSVKAQFDF